jgi:D-lactate dehydrogenase
MVISFYGDMDQEKKDYYLSQLSSDQLKFYPESLNSQTSEIDPETEVVSIFVGCKSDKETLAKFPQLKMVAIRSTGFDNVDLDYAKSKGIVVCNVPAYGSHTVAEFAFSLILNLSRKTFLALEKTKKGEFGKEGFRGFDLYGKTLGVVGTGKIGMNVIRIAKGFGMKVLANDMYPNERISSELGFSYISLEQLLEESDIVTLHAPATKDTEHLINSQNITKFKKGAVLINTARGKLVETEALYEALVSGQIAAAALDVLEEEEKLESLPDGSVTKKLIKLENVLFTPHVAFYTKEAEENIMQTTAENIKGFTTGAVVNSVN